MWEGAASAFADLFSLERSPAVFPAVLADSVTVWPGLVLTRP